MVAEHKQKKTGLRLFTGVSGKAICCIFILALAGCLPPPAGYRWYYVRRGDTLWSIARKNKFDFFSLVNANGIRKPSRIYPGMKLKIPSRGSAAARREKGDRSFFLGKKQIKKDLSPFSKRVKKKAPPAAVSFSWPVKGKVLKHFGKSNLTRSLGIVVKAKTPSVKAAAPGKVSFCGKAGNFGNTVIIKHASGYHSVYGYLEKISVKTDETVAGGSLIGSCQSSKKYGGRALYFEIRFDTEAYDPLMYLN